MLYGSVHSIYLCCLVCEKPYLTHERYLRRGGRRGRFCSQACAGRYRTQKTLENQKPNCVCYTCSKHFYRRESKILSKLQFCSRVCKEAQQVIGGPLALASYGDYTGTRAGHRYRELAFKVHPNLCNRCGYNRYKDVLVVHHKDRNRSNNTPDNLEILCPNCHEEEHFAAKDGKWTTSGSRKQSNSNRTWPPTETKSQIKQLVKTTSMSDVARKYGVAPNTIKNYITK